MCIPAGAMGKLPLEGTSQHPIQSAAHLGRAIVEEVVVWVIRMLWLRIPGEECRELPGRLLADCCGPDRAKGRT